MFGINGSEFIILMIVVVVVIGPERMPEYAAKLARLVRQLREWLTLLRRSCASRWARSSMTSTGNSTTFVSTTLAASFGRLSPATGPITARHRRRAPPRPAGSRGHRRSRAMTRTGPRRMTRKPPNTALWCARQPRALADSPARRAGHVRSLATPGDHFSLSGRSGADSEDHVNVRRIRSDTRSSHADR